MQTYLQGRRLLILESGYEAAGSTDLEICLPTDSMEALESDEEFMYSVSLSLAGANHRLK